MRAEAVLQLLRLIAGTSGLLVVLEDLHWSDPDTLAVVEYLADNLPAEPVLCVATVRTERTDAPSDALLMAERLHARRGATVITLDRLTDRQVEDMARACLFDSTVDRIADGTDHGNVDSTGDLLARIRANADGVPFLVEELLASPGVPRSLADAVRARMQNIGEDDRTTLEFAAVLGRQFDWRLLPDATGLPPEAVARALRTGADAQLLGAEGTAFSSVMRSPGRPWWRRCCRPAGRTSPVGCWPSSKHSPANPHSRWSISRPTWPNRRVTGVARASCWRRPVGHPWIVVRWPPQRTLSGGPASYWRRVQTDAPPYFR